MLLKQIYMKKYNNQVTSLPVATHIVGAQVWMSPIWVNFSVV